MSTDNETLLERLVASLSLADGRINAKGSASNMTVQTARHAGFLFIEDPDQLRSAGMPFGRKQNMASGIIKRLQSITEGYLGGSDDKRVKIQVDLEDTVLGKDMTSFPKFVDGINTLMMHLIKNKIGNSSENPFVFNKTPPAKPNTRGTPPDYKRIQRIGPVTPVLEEISDDNLRLKVDTLKDGLSWFHALFLSAEGKAETSEMSVQQVIGGPLHSLVSLPGCDILSNQKLDYPDILKLSVAKSADTTPTALAAKKGRKAKGKTAPQRDAAAANQNLNPSGGNEGTNDESSGGKATGDCLPDLATRPALPADKSKIKNKAHKLMLQPTLIIGEGKKVDTGAGKESQENKAHYSVQLAMAGHPAMVLLLLLEYDGQEFDEKKHKADLNQECFVYAIYYDAVQFYLYAQFPYYYTAPPKSSESSGWRFAQVKLKEIQFATLDLDMEHLEESLRRRTEFAVAIQAVREHGRKLHEIFTSKKYQNLIKLLSEGL
ncbi:hypothetical protein EIP86_008418 [Pleurotus ostreatoroseus]|nr:hypothetical protein EIP86_008418 [Pleurotus ostreatoroseus]